MNIDETCNNEILKTFMNKLDEGVYCVDLNRKINFWNDAAKNISGFDSSEVVGSYCYDNILKHVDGNGKNLCLDGCPLHKTLEDGEERKALVFLHHKGGHRVPVEIKVVPIN